jgi:hypothetical protein
MAFTHAEQMFRCYQRYTETITAEHHPNEGGMPYLIRIIGGKHTGTEIHCTTEASAIALFDSLVAARKAEREHPFLQDVGEIVRERYLPPSKV